MGRGGEEGGGGEGGEGEERGGERHVPRRYRYRYPLPYRYRMYEAVPNRYPIKKKGA